MITKVVIPAAGLGTRLLTATKEQPKEMLPVFARGSGGSLLVKPILQLVFEQLFVAGFREFCFIVGKGKRAIEDHFTPDYSFVNYLEKKGKADQAEGLKELYERIEQSSIFWLNQPEPRGFGDAVHLSKSFVKGGRFLVHGGDAYIVSQRNDHLNKLLAATEKFNADATLMTKTVHNPELYGVIEADLIDDANYRVKRAVEKPKSPPSNLGLLPVYVFNQKLIDALESVQPDSNDEIQLTDGIQRVIEEGGRVYAVKLDAKSIWLDVGSPQHYWAAQSFSYKTSTKKT